MELIDVIVLAVIQGLTEFLPVSSSGHLVAARVLFNIPDVQGNAFDAFLHLGTLLAVLVYFRRVWWGMVRGIAVGDDEGRDKRELAAKLALATVPAAVVGYALQNTGGEWWRSSTSVAFGLLSTAMMLLAVDLINKRIKTIARANFLDAVLIGLAQIVALIPGVSRSGVTMAAGRARGLSRRQSATFSFLMSAPIIAGAGLSSLSLLTVGNWQLSQLLLAFIVSFVAGVVAIRVVLKVVERIAFWPFAIYLLVLSLWLFNV